MPVYAELTTVELIDLLIREEDRVTLEHIQELAARNRISDPARPGPDGEGHLIRIEKAMRQGQSLSWRIARSDHLKKAGSGNR